MSIQDTFQKYSVHHDLFLTFPAAKSPRCKAGEFQTLKNTEWLTKIQPTDNLGLKLAKFGRKDNQLACLEADTAEQDDALDSFIRRRNIDALVYRGDNGGFKHYIVRADNRLLNVRRYLGFEVKHDWILIPPSKTDSGKRAWRNGDEERFIANDIPSLPNDAVEEILRSQQTVLRTFRHGFPIINRADWPTDFLVELGFTEGPPHDWTRPGSTSGGRSLQINWPANGYIHVTSSAIKGLPQGKYPFQYAYARLKGISLQQAYSELGLGDCDLGTVVSVPYYFDDRFECVVKEISSINKKGDVKIYPSFTVEAYFEGDLQWAGLKASTAKGKQELLVKKIVETLRIPQEDAETIVAEIVEEVASETEVQIEQQDEMEAGKKPHSFTLDVQAETVSMMRQELDLLVWRGAILKREPGKYWYATTQDQYFSGQIHEYIKRTGLPTCTDDHCNRVCDELRRTMSRPEMDAADPPYDKETGQTDDRLIAYDDKPVRITDTGEQVDVNPNSLVVLDALPYTKAEIEAADTGVVEQLLAEWFPDNLGATSVRRFFKQLMGLVISNIRPQVVFWLSGPGGTGKSNATTLLADMLNPSRVTVKTGWKSLEHRFSSDRLENASLVICSELKGNAGGDALAWLKAVTGERRIEVDVKQQRQREIRLRATVVCASNDDMPARDQALTTRKKLIPMLRVFRGTEDDKPEHVEKLLIRNGRPIPGVYRVAIEGLLDYVRNGFVDLSDAELLMKIFAVQDIIKTAFEYTGKATDSVRLSAVKEELVKRGLELPQIELKEVFLPLLKFKVVNHGGEWWLAGYRREEF